MRRYIRLPNGEVEEIEAVWTPQAGWMPTKTNAVRRGSCDYAAYLASIAPAPKPAP